MSIWIFYSQKEWSQLIMTNISCSKANVSPNLHRPRFIYPMCDKGLLNSFPGQVAFLSPLFWNMLMISERLLFQFLMDMRFTCYYSVRVKVLQTAAETCPTDLPEITDVTTISNSCNTGHKWPSSWQPTVWGPHGLYTDHGTLLLASLHWSVKHYFFHRVKGRERERRE